MQTARLPVSSSSMEGRGVTQNCRLDRELAAHKGLTEEGSDPGDTLMTVESRLWPGSVVAGGVAGSMNSIIA